jgi:hypothetical protein
MSDDEEGWSDVDEEYGGSDIGGVTGEGEVRVKARVMAVHF